MTSCFNEFLETALASCCLQDPQSSELDQHPGRLENVVNLIRKRLHADPPVNRRSAERLMYVRVLSE